MIQLRYFLAFVALLFLERSLDVQAPPPVPAALVIGHCDDMCDSPTDECIACLDKEKKCNANKDLPECKECTPGVSFPSPYDTCNTCQCLPDGYIGGCTLVFCQVTRGIGQTCGIVWPSNDDVGACEPGLYCKSDPSIPDKPAECEIEGTRGIGQTCGITWPENRSVGDCAPGLYCKSDPSIPDKPAECDIPGDRQHGQTCGITLPSNSDVGDCAPGLECKSDPSIPDKPAECDFPGEKCGIDRCGSGTQCCFTCDDNGGLTVPNGCSEFCAQPLCIVKPPETGCRETAECPPGTRCSTEGIQDDRPLGECIGHSG